MKYNPAIHHRRSIRLKGYDYAQEGAYFVTLCSHRRELLFGEIIKERIRLSEMGEIVRDEWLRTMEVRKNVDMDAFIVMPDHLHGIILITDQLVRATRRVAPTRRGPELRSGSLGAIIGQFKSVSAKRVNKYRRTSGNAVWQRNYYEHIIRDEGDLNRIRGYILNNPLQWFYEKDRSFPPQ